MGSPASVENAPVFMKGVSKIFPVTDTILRNKVLKKASLMTGWEGDGFPGSVLVPMSKSNIDLLKDEEYFVGSKLDGTRYLMLIDGFELVYFINRNGEVFHTSHVQFPSSNVISKGKIEHLKNTLLDGEMIFPKNTNGASKPYYMIFDAMCIQNNNLTQYDFSMRNDCIKDIIDARKGAIDAKIIEPQGEPFSIQTADFYSVKDAEEVMKRSLPFETDGLVFYPEKRAYNCWPKVPGVNHYALKWKPASLNTVDFQLRIDKEKRLGNLYVSGHDLPFGTIDLTSDLEILDGKIIECKWQNDKWVLLRERWDRNMPNSFATTKETMQSIEDGISEDELIAFISRIPFKNGFD